MRYVRTDQVGIIIGMTDANNALLNQQRYTPWGEIDGSQLEDQQDASGTFYRRNCYYDANTGRFTQEDPIGLAGGLNLYGYAGDVVAGGVRRGDDPKQQLAARPDS